MIKDYFVNIPPTLAEVLADIGGKDAGADFDEIVNAAYSSFFSFYSPTKITASLAEDLEKYVLNYFIMRRVGSGNIRKWRQMFRNKWNTIMPYYERLLETEEKESDYFTNPILNADIHNNTNANGTLDSTEDTTRNTDTEFNTQRKTLHEGEDTHTTDDAITKTHQGTNEKTHSGTNSESASVTEINRYSDTPQGDSSKIWEIDAQGHPVLNNIYLTDIRGITTNSQRSGQDQYTENGNDQANDGETLDRDEAGTDKYEDNTTGKDTTDFDETGKKILDQDTSHHQTDDKRGYDGVSPAELLAKYRETFLRIYEDIANEMEEVFYNLIEVDDLIDFV